MVADDMASRFLADLENQHTNRDDAVTACYYCTGHRRPPDLGMAEGGAWKPMTKYYPLIARAVAGLDQNTGETRRALYEHVRTALVNKLRGLDPPLSDVEITSERLGLEEAISRVEAEAARHPAAGSRPGSISRSSTTTAAEPYWRSRKALRASERSTISSRRWGSERSRCKEPFVPQCGLFLKALACSRPTEMTEQSSIAGSRSSLTRSVTGSASTLRLSTISPAPDALDIRRGLGV